MLIFFLFFLASICLLVGEGICTPSFLFIAWTIASCSESFDSLKSFDCSKYLIALSASDCLLSLFPLRLLRCLVFVITSLTTLSTLSFLTSSSTTSSWSCSSSFLTLVGLPGPPCGASGRVFPSPTPCSSTLSVSPVSLLPPSSDSTCSSVFDFWMASCFSFISLFCSFKMFSSDSIIAGRFAFNLTSFSAFKEAKASSLVTLTSVVVSPPEASIAWAVSSAFKISICLSTSSIFLSISSFNGPSKLLRWSINFRLWFKSAAASSWFPLITTEPCVWFKAVCILYISW